MSRIHQWRRIGVEQRLIEVAEQLLITRGPEQIPLTLVARAANVSRATVYNYFGDQRGLMSKLAIYRFRTLVGMLDQVLRTHEEPRAQLTALIHESIDFFERHSRFFRILVRERGDAALGGPRDGLTSTISKGMEEYASRLAIPLRAGIRQRLFVGQEPDRMACAIAGMITHAVLQILQHPTPATRKAEIDIVENIIFHAVLAEPTKPQRSRSARPRGRAP